ncbi:MAG: hypothetical protein RL204_1549 [Bacteroidota bacterium]|jgi:hypothetical protein
MLQITSGREKHMLRHFNGDAIGSAFDTAVFADVNALLEYINSHQPNQIIPQTNGREAWIFICSEFESIGHCGLMNRKDVPVSQIVEEMRDGHLMDVGFVEELPRTNKLCVVVEHKETGVYLITAFPGERTVAFPYGAQSPEERELSEAFWKEHILVRGSTGIDEVISAR